MGRHREGEMGQAYSDPRRENEPTSLPDVEVFFMTPEEAIRHTEQSDDDSLGYEPGWYYWFCFPGCLPDSEPIGPFGTEQEALEDAQEGSGDDEL